MQTKKNKKKKPRVLEEKKKYLVVFGVVHTQSRLIVVYINKMTDKLEIF